MFIPTSVVVEHQDVTAVDVDVIALKYAQSFHGADSEVAQNLENKGIPAAALTPAKGRHVIVDSVGAVRARKVLLVGVPPLALFSYSDVRQLACDVLSILAAEAPETSSVAMTLHGAGFGLDEVECIEQQLEGYRDAMSTMRFPRSLTRIVIVERNSDRIKLITQVLASSLKYNDPFLYGPAVDRGRGVLEYSLPPEADRPIIADPSEKAKIFVAMPFAKEMRDIWTFGIQQSVRNAGLLCERIDEEAFTGDILDQIKSKIETADLIIADLTGANPNVFLEVGYAWGKSRPVLLLSRIQPRPRAAQRPFDVSSHKCILYEDATHLHDQLEIELRKLALVRHR